MLVVPTPEAETPMPSVFYASKEGWAAILRMLNQPDHQEPDAAVIAWLRGSKA